MSPRSSRTPTRALVRHVLARRRLLAALCAAVAVVAGVRAASAPPAPASSVVVASRDLPAGAVLAAGDLSETGFAPGTPPSGAASDPADLVGATLAAPLRAGEPVTDVRLLGPGLVAADPTLVAVPVRLPDAGAVALLSPGDRVDLLATDPEGSGSRTVLAGAPVLATPRPVDEGGGVTASGQPGALVVLGVPPSQVASVADAGVRHFLGFAWSR